MERTVRFDAEGDGCGTDLNRGVMGWFFLPRKRHELLRQCDAQGIYDDENAA